MKSKNCYLCIECDEIIPKEELVNSKGSLRCPICCCSSLIPLSRCLGNKTELKELPVSMRIRSGFPCTG